MFYNEWSHYVGLGLTVKKRHFEKIVLLYLGPSCIIRFQFDCYDHIYVVNEAEIMVIQIVIKKMLFMQKIRS